MRFAFAADVGEIILDGARFAFALGDGSIAWEDGARRQVHDGPVLTAAVHPRGPGVISGGDDGRLAASTPEASDVLAEAPGKWIDALAVSPVSGLIAFASGRQVQVLDVADRAFARVFDHERSVAGLAFDAKGRRLAAATYGGLALWYAKIAGQKPVMLRWAGSHLEPVFSPDGRFVVSAMQEPALHGWRLADGADLAMSGYPAKVRSLAFVDRGHWLATSGASSVILLALRRRRRTDGQARRRIGLSTSQARWPAWPDRTTEQSWPRLWTTVASGPATSPPTPAGSSSPTPARPSGPCSSMAPAAWPGATNPAPRGSSTWAGCRAKISPPGEVFLGAIPTIKTPASRTTRRADRAGCASG